MKETDPKFQHDGKKKLGEFLRESVPVSRFDIMVLLGGMAVVSTVLGGLVVNKLNQREALQVAVERVERYLHRKRECERAHDELALKQTENPTIYRNALNRSRIICTQNDEVGIRIKRID